MTEDLGGGYLSGLPEDQRDELTRVNAPGLAALREYLASGEAVAFLGAGASRPLYPLWDGLIGELVDAAANRLFLLGQPHFTHPALADRLKQAIETDDCIGGEKVHRCILLGMIDGELSMVLAVAQVELTIADKLVAFDAGAGTGLPVPVQGRGDHQL